MEGLEAFEVVFISDGYDTGANIKRMPRIRNQPMSGRVRRRTNEMASKAESVFEDAASPEREE